MANHKEVIDGVRSEIVRLMQLQTGSLKTLMSSPELFDDASADPKKQSMTVVKAEGFLDVLANEITKAQNLELVVAVVGTMKAGKSTTINAIVGTEVLPNRSAPMTTLPTAIRHTPGVTEPKLTFGKTEPFDKLITQLTKDYRSQLEQELDRSKTTTSSGVPYDVHPLVKALLDGELKQLEKTYQGRESIYGFLNRLNDLVRLASAVGIPDSPLDAYLQIDHFPLIEIEFSHLKSIEGYGNGKFTLLDTPGPNEAARGKQLVQVLKNQLTKASAILAVIDYTQRGSDSDKQLCDFLEEVISDKLGRVFVAVNQFDRRGPNDSNDTAALSNEVSRKSFSSKVSPSNVFPVSSKNAFYANAALRELDAGRKLNLAETWVVEFGDISMGRLAKKHLADSAACKDAAIDLLEDSLFSKLIKPVIQDGYRSAAFTAMHSAIAVVENQNKVFSDFLGIRLASINGNAQNLKELVAGLQSDVEAVSSATEVLHEKANTAQSLLLEKIKNIHELSSKKVNTQLADFFKSGKHFTEETNQRLIEADTKQYKTSRKKSSSRLSSQTRIFSLLEHFNERPISIDKNKQLENLVPHQLFDPDEPRVVFSEESEANKFAASIKAEIKKVIEDLDVNIRLEFSKAIDVLSSELQYELTENYLKPIAKRVGEKVKNNLNYNLTIQLSSDALPSAEAFSLRNLDDNMVNHEETSHDRTRRVDQDGIFGSTKRAASWLLSKFVDTDWGTDYETYTEYENHFIVDLENIHKHATKDIQKGFKDFTVLMKAHVKTHVMPQIDTALKAMNENLCELRNTLLQGIADTMKSEQQQEKIKLRLEALTANQKKVQSDLNRTKRELGTVTHFDKAA